MDRKTDRFIDERIEVRLSDRPTLEKRPRCPGAFTWRGRPHEIAECLSEWHDFTRRGRMARNMRPDHLAAAERTGSWGVGRHYFRVRTTEGHRFELYYDRAPKSTRDRKGAWYLFRELASEGEPR